MELSLKQISTYLIYVYTILVLFSDGLGDLPVQIIRVLLAGVLVLYFIRKHRLHKSFFVVWACFFLLYNVIISFFALNTAIAGRYTLSLFYIYFIDILVCLYLYDENVIDGIWNAFIVGALVKALRTYTRYGFLTFLNTRSAGAVSANSIGDYCAIAVILCFVFYVDGKANAKYSRYRIWFLVAGIMNLLFALLSASRKAFVFLLVPLLLITLLDRGHWRKRVRHILVWMLLGAVFVLAVFKIPFLYRLVGSRLISMVRGLFGGETDSSTNTRLILIRTGWDWFKERPLFGYGMMNFKELSSAIHRELYAHNNYIELLVDAGLVGTLLYYYLYFWIVKNGRLVYKRCPDIRAKLILSMMAAILIAEFGLVTYFSAPIQLLIMSFFSYVALQKKRELILKKPHPGQEAGRSIDTHGGYRT